MLQVIEHKALTSVGRACGFAAIGILTFVVGLSGEMVMAFKGGAFLALIACCVLLLKAWGADATPHKRTELWLMLQPSERPHPAIAQQIIATVLRETYLRFALHAAVFAVLMLASAILYAALFVGSA